MKRENRLAYCIGTVSLVYWLLVWLIPTYRLITPEGMPLNGIGIIVSAFNDTSFSLLVMSVSLIYLLSISRGNERFRLAMTSLLFGIWFMSTMAYFGYAYLHGTIAPNLIIHAGYCYTIWLEVRKRE